jgi:hypothetical protein
MRDAMLLHAIHGGPARILGEDFAGTAAISRAWVALVAGGRATAVDNDAEPMARCAGVVGVESRVADVMQVRTRADVIAVMNFSICEWHDRVSLVRYLRHARTRLSAGGVFIASLFGGADAFVTGRYQQSLEGPGGQPITYEWEQRSADAATGRVVCAMHFRVGRRPWMRDAFVYDWRLWSIAELRDAMGDAGFRATDVYDHAEHAIDADGTLHPRHITDGGLPESYQVLVAGRR